MKSERCWVRTTIGKTSDGDKIYYGSRHNSKCPSGVYLLFHWDNLAVSLFVNNAEHTTHVETEFGINGDTKDAIIRLVRKFRVIFISSNLPETKRISLKHVICSLKSGSQAQKKVFVILWIILIHHGYRTRMAGTRDGLLDFQIRKMLSNLTNNLVDRKSVV